MARFRDVKARQKVAAAHSWIHNHFNQERGQTPHTNHDRVQQEGNVSLLLGHVELAV